MISRVQLIKSCLEYARLDVKAPYPAILKSAAGELERAIGIEIRLNQELEEMRAELRALNSGYSHLQLELEARALDAAAI